MKTYRNQHYTSRRKKRLRRHIGIILLLCVCVASLSVAGYFLVQHFNQTPTTSNTDSVSATESTGSSQTPEAEKPSDSSKQPDSSQKEEPSQTEESKKPSSSETAASGIPEGGLHITDRPKMNVLDDNEKVVYLTFDDGPCDTTRDLLALLKKYNAKATFFDCCQTANQEQYLDVIKDCVDQGHTVAVHTYSHKMQEVYASPEAYYEDFEKMYSLIQEISGKEPANFFRFPGGSKNGYNEKIRTDVINEMVGRGFIYYDWDCDSGDAAGNHVPADVIYQNTMGAIRNGCNIVLMHNTFGKETTIEALKRILPDAIAEGYEFRALDGTLDPTHYYIFTPNQFIDAALNNKDMLLSDWQMAKLESSKSE